MGKRGKILLVDDDYDFVQGTRIILESAGHRVEVAYDGGECLAKARDFRPDLIILDVILPTRDGLSTCSLLKRDPEFSRIPVLMLTTLSRTRDELPAAAPEAPELLADDFVTKPAKPAELLLRVARLLSRPETLA